MDAILYSLGALIIAIAGLAAYQLAMAYAALAFGIRVREVKIGVGPTVFRKVGKNWTLRIAAIPLGGSTAFRGMSEPDADEEMGAGDEWSDPEVGRYQDATPLAQMCILVSGPLIVVLFGLLCLSMPVLAGDAQLEACDPSESTVRPCGVPGLTLRDRSSSWHGQGLLFRETAVEFTVRMFTFQSLDGWGGWVAFLVTCGSAGALSFWAWLSCVGVLLLMFATYNLLPIPLLNGYNLLLVAVRGATGRDVAMNARIALAYVGLILMLIVFGRVFWLILPGCGS